MLLSAALFIYNSEKHDLFIVRVENEEYFLIMYGIFDVLINGESYKIEDKSSKI